MICGGWNVKKTHLQAEFIILRATGMTLKEISERLGISTKTAERWNRKPEIQEEIKELKRQELEQLKDTLSIDQQERINILTATIKQIDNAILEKSLQNLSANTLLTLKLKYLKELRAEENTF